MKSARWGIGVATAAAMALLGGRADAEHTSTAAGTGRDSTAESGANSRSVQPGTGSISGHVDTLKGRVQDFDRSNNTLTLSGTDKMLKIDPNTRVMKDGERASIDDIKEGERVRASFSGSADTPHVQTLDIISNGETSGGSSGTGSSGASGGPTTGQPESGYAPIGRGTSTGTGATGSGSMSGSRGITTDLTTGSGTGTGAEGGTSAGWSTSPAK